LTGVRVWLVDLDDRDSLGGKRPRQAGRVRACRLDADPLDLTVRAEPVDQLAVAGGGCRERGGAEWPPLEVEHRDLVLVGVRVDAGDNVPLIGHPFSHRPFRIGAAGRDGRTQQ
jgi:hypothetical protein